MFPPSCQRPRLAGRIIVVSAIGIVSPLAAAIPTAPQGGIRAPYSAISSPHAQLPVLPAAAGQPSPHFDGSLSFDGDLVTIHGKTAPYEDLTASEKDEVRQAVARAREALVRSSLRQQARRRRQAEGRDHADRVDEISVAADALAQRSLRQASNALATIEAHIEADERRHH